VRFGWKDYTIDERVQLRDLLLAIISQLSSTAHPKYIEEKAARVFTELVERVWPTEWNELYTLLCSLSSSVNLSMQL
jgi:hypothetical protein